MKLLSVLTSALAVVPILGSAQAISHQAPPLPVRQVRATEPLSFKHGLKGSFQSRAFPDAPVRLRVFRGSSDEILAEIAKLNVKSDACVRLQSLVIHPYRDSTTVALPTSFSDGWLTPTNGGVRDGSFVFVFEVPEADWSLAEGKSEVEPIEFKEGQAREYLKHGVDVTILAPIHGAKEDRAKDEIHKSTKSSAKNASGTATGAVSAAGTVSRPPNVTNCHGVVVQPPPYEIVLVTTDQTVTVAELQER